MTYKASFPIVPPEERDFLSFHQPTGNFGGAGRKGRKMARCEINGGICGFVTVVEAEQSATEKINLKITSACPNIKKVAEDLTEIDPMDEIFRRAASTQVYAIMSRHSPHPSCVVGSGILKTIEVEAGLALPQEAYIKVEK